MSDTLDIFNLPDLPPLKDDDYKRVIPEGEWNGITWIGDFGFIKVRYEGKVYRNRVKTRSPSE